MESFTGQGGSGGGPEEDGEALWKGNILARGHFRKRSLCIQFPVKLLTASKSHHRGVYRIGFRRGNLLGWIIGRRKTSAGLA